MSSDEAERKPTYPGGIDAVLAQMEGRRDGISYAPGEALPGLDIPLDALVTQKVENPAEDPDEQPPFRSTYHRKRFALREEFEGESELCFLNGLLIAHLRKRVFPPHAPALFQRLWREHSGHLLAHLNARWLVSSVTTFGDHGTTDTQRAVGLALNVLFGTMKLYETERLFSGLTPDRPFTLDNKARGKLPLEMDAFSITHGGLDVNMLGRLWAEAGDDPVIGPLAHHLIDLLIHDPRGVFRRLRVMRARKERRDRKESQGEPQKTPEKPNIAPVPTDRPAPDAATLRWGLVSTIRAPLPDIARFAAWHLTQGACALHIHLDEPDEDTAAVLRRDPRIHVVQCDAAYWDGIGKHRPDAHQLRQAINATRTLRATSLSLDWLGHLDVDEFLISRPSVAEILAGVPPDTAMARIPPAEALAREDGPPSAYKLTHIQVQQAKAILQDIYPTFGMHLYGGFLSHTVGKVFARTGIDDTRLGIHTLKYRGEDVSNRIKPPGYFVLHHHAPSWDHFRAHLEFRRTRGSYRARSSRPELGQSELFDYLTDSEGEDGLRAFFDEVCADSPGLRERLAAHGMLIQARLDLDAAVSRIFGALP